MVELLLNNPALIALLGVAVGALLTGGMNFLLQLIQDKRKSKQEKEKQNSLWAREDRTRHHDDRLKVYRDMYGMVRTEKLGFLKNERQVLSGVVDREKLVAAVEDLALHHSEIQLIASSKQVREASQMMLHEALKLRAIVNVQLEANKSWNPSPQDLGKLLNPLINRRDQFRKAAREELQIPEISS